MADGRVFTGQEALKQGMIDEYGGLKEAITKAKQLGGIPASADPEIIYEDGRYSLFEELFGANLSFLNKVDSTLDQGTSMKFIYRPGLF
jgi:protease-4